MEQYEKSAAFYTCHPKNLIPLYLKIFVLYHKGAFRSESMEERGGST